MLICTIFTTAKVRELEEEIFILPKHLSEVRFTEPG
jgi:hypothetical protein